MPITPTECSNSGSLYCLRFFISTARVPIGGDPSYLIDAMRAGYLLGLGGKIVADFSLELLDRGCWDELFQKREILGRIVCQGRIFVHLLMELSARHPIPIVIRGGR